MGDTAPVNVQDAIDQTTVPDAVERHGRDPISMRDKDPVNVQEANDKIKIWKHHGEVRPR